jgi:hypothetical protein
VKMIRVQTTKT